MAGKLTYGIEAVAKACWNTARILIGVKRRLTPISRERRGLFACACGSP